MNWTGRSVDEQQLLEALGLGEEQVGPLVGGEAAGEADGQRARVEEVVGPRGLRGRAAAPHRPLLDPLAHERHEAGSGLLLDPPELVVGCAPDACPALGRRLVPLGEHVARQQVGHVGRDPGAAVDAVGDRTDRHLVGLEVGPELVEHLPADLDRAARTRRWSGRRGAGP